MSGWSVPQRSTHWKDVSPATSSHVGEWLLALQAVALEVQVLESPVLLWLARDERHMEVQSTQSAKEHVAHTSGLRKALAFGDEVAVISHGLGGCRAEGGCRCQQVREGTMPVP